MVTGSRLAELMLRGPTTNHVVCFGRDGAERRCGELIVAAAGVEARLREQDGERWALNLGDGFELTAALLGCWAARRTPVLVPPTLLATLDRATLDGVIEHSADATAAARRIVWQTVEASARPLGELAPNASLELYTSGSTGVPKKAGRRLANIENELAALESVWGARLGTARVLSTVSHRHVYGFLFRILWPLLERRPFAIFDYEYPEQLLGSGGRGNVLVSSPAMLKRVGHLPPGSGQWSAVFSSGGFLPADAAADVSRVLGVAATEILGSTETSGVAWRTAGSPSFELLPSVEVRVSSDELLEVRSPFAGVDGWQAMGDRVHFRADGTFELSGRADRIAKIEDKRVSLSEIERRLVEHHYVKDAAAVALEASARQYVGAVVELTQAGRAALEQRGRAAMNSALRSALRGRIEAVALPRAFRYTHAMPVDAQGKRQVAVLAALFDSGSV
ncbi:MAG: acyl-CoA synthetase [Lysobacterales bacterium]|nr:MAG: acyl-CoA synthetase [Xanthomonadales bacterium]